MLYDVRESLPFLPEEIPERVVFLSQIRKSVDSFFSRKRIISTHYHDFRETTDREKRFVDRNRIILNMRFGLDGNKQHTLLEIADCFQLNKARVREILEKLFRQMRHSKSGFARLSEIND